LEWKETPYTYAQWSSRPHQDQNIMGSNPPGLEDLGIRHRNAATRVHICFAIECSLGKITVKSSDKKVIIYKLYIHTYSKVAKFG
jgi:hypothetical protein